MTGELRPVLTPCQYYAASVAAFIRGSLPAPVDACAALWTCPLHLLAEDEITALLALGHTAGLRLDKFKRSTVLPRVKAVLGLLAGFAPQSLLDIGSGRGAFLWPLLDAWPRLPVTTIETDAIRARDLLAVQTGGLSTLTAQQMDAGALAFPDRHFEIVTALEVLEHIPDWQQACAHIVRVASRAVILSVPSKPDNNSEHLHLLDSRLLEAQLRLLGVRRMQCRHVANHLILTAQVTV